jgi:hypothetical protein
MFPNETRAGETFRVDPLQDIVVGTVAQLASNAGDVAHALAMS